MSGVAHVHVCRHVKVRKQHTGEVFVPGGNCTEKRGSLIAQALLEQQSLFNKLAFCENALAHDMLACWRNWIP